MYAKHEEEHGLPKAAMDIYKRATKAVLPTEAHEVCVVLISTVLQSSSLATVLQTPQ